MPTWVISRHFGKTARFLLSPTADIGGAIPITEISPRLAPPAKLCSLFKKKSQLPVAASPYWSLAMMIAATMVVDAPRRGRDRLAPAIRSVGKTETAPLPAPFLVHSRGPAHFGWLWRERPALALLAWDTYSRSIN
jgi:hypothetical protein